MFINGQTPMTITSAIITDANGGLYELIESCDTNNPNASGASWGIRDIFTGVTQLGDVDIDGSNSFMTTFALKRLDLEGMTLDDRTDIYTMEYFLERSAPRYRTPWRNSWDKAILIAHEDPNFLVACSMNYMTRIAYRATESERYQMIGSINYVNELGEIVPLDSPSMF